MYLKNDQLFLFENDSKESMEKAKKMVNMKNVSCVCEHYDVRAPVKSKKIENEQIDMSRFDVYTLGRIFYLKSENGDIENSKKWVQHLQDCG